MGEEVTEFDDSEITLPEVIGSRLFLLIKSSAFSKQLKAKSKECMEILLKRQNVTYGRPPTFAESHHL